MPFFVVSGPSGAGKGSVVREALARRPDIWLSLSATTRPMRPGEIDGVHYNFITQQEFRSLRDRGEFLESAEVYGHSYATPRAPIERALEQGRSVIAELDIQGALSVKRARPDAVLIFIEPPTLDALRGRLRGRGTEDPDSMARRLQAAYEEVKNKALYDHVIVNDDLRRAADELLRILDKEESSRR